MSKIVKKVLELKEKGVKVLELPDENSYHVLLGKYESSFELDEYISQKIGVMSSSEYTIDFDDIRNKKGIIINNGC